MLVGVGTNKSKTHVLDLFWIVNAVRQITLQRFLLESLLRQPLEQPLLLLRPMRQQPLGVSLLPRQPLPSCSLPLVREEPLLRLLSCQPRLG